MAWTTSREELAWAAGFFCGEGSTYADPYPRLCVVQNDREVLDKFNDAIGGYGRIGGGVRIYGRAKKPMFALRISGWRDVQIVVAMLWPWLSTAKRQQATSILKTNIALMNANPKYGNNRNRHNPLCGRPHGSSGGASCRSCQRIREQHYEARKKGAVAS